METDVSIIAFNNALSSYLGPQPNITYEQYFSCENRPYFKNAQLSL